MLKYAKPAEVMANVIPFPQLAIPEVPREEVGRAHWTHAALVYGLRNENRRALCEFFQQYSASIERVAFRILGNGADCEDVVQETALRVLDKMERVDRPEGFPRFVMAIAVNVTREHLRRRRRNHWLQFFAPEDVPEVVDGADNPEAREALSSFYKILQTLDEEVRVILVLRLLERFELMEVAQMVGRSLATVKRKLRSGLSEVEEKARRDAALSLWLSESTRNLQEDVDGGEE